MTLKSTPDRLNLRRKARLSRVIVSNQTAFAALVETCRISARVIQMAYEEVANPSIALAAMECEDDRLRPHDLTAGSLSENCNGPLVAELRGK